MTLLAQCGRIERHDGADKPTLARPMSIGARTARHSNHCPRGGINASTRRPHLNRGPGRVSSVIIAVTVTLIHLQTLIAAGAAWRPRIQGLSE